jgi:hypothetical protein
MDTLHITKDVLNILSIYFMPNEHAYHFIGQETKTLTKRLVPIEL